MPLGAWPEKDSEKVKFRNSPGNEDKTKNHSIATRVTTCQCEITPDYNETGDALESRKSYCPGCALL